MMTAYKIETNVKHNYKSDETSVVFIYAIFLPLMLDHRILMEG